MMRQALKAGVLIATACIPLLVQGQWKWRDAEGRMQYSDRAPPRGTADKDILTRPAHAPLRLVAESPSTSAASSPQGKASSPAEAARRASEPASVHPNKADEARRQQRSDNCHRAQEYARTLDEGQRVQRVNAQGEREFLDEGQRSRERDKARQVMDAECS